MIASFVTTAARVLVLAGMLVLSLTASGPTAAWAAEIRTNVAVYLSLREILFFSAETGAWTAVRLDPGERVLSQGVDGNVAAVVTSLRVIGFSGPLSAADNVRILGEELVEALRVEGNVATLLTKRLALGFSALTARWASIDRAFPAR
jgi:hypothetical protein